MRTNPASSWLIIGVGLLLMYVPSIIDLLHGPWGSDKNAHGPIVLAVALVYMGVRLRQLVAQGLFKREPAPVAGALLLAAGLLIYALGRSQSVLLFEIGSLIIVLSAILVAFFGVRTWSRMWFAFFFMLFMIPLPSSIVDLLTMPLKIGVSYASEHLLYWMGYPISRSGVILNMGQYQLLVADACAGLNSLFTLEALGLLYMNLVRHPSVVRNVTLALLIVPISFTANTIRIVTLALITYYMGDAAGQGFLHGFSGMVLFLSALGLIIAVDSGLSWLVTRGKPDIERAAPTPSVAGIWQGATAVAAAPSLAILVAMAGAVGAAHALTPVMPALTQHAKLADSVPSQFGDWREVTSNLVQADLSTTEEGGRTQDQPYDDVLMRTYVNSEGVQIMLALATSREQRQDVKIHLPEVCYPAQGFQVTRLTPAALAVDPAGGSVPGKHLITKGNNRNEAVSYWVRIGDDYPQGGLAMRTKIFRDGLAGKVADGILVRASTLVHTDEEALQAYAVQEKFLAQLVSAVKPTAPALVASTLR